MGFGLSGWARPGLVKVFWFFFSKKNGFLPSAALFLAAWSGAIIVDSVARPGSHDGLVLSLPAVAILGIAAILFFAWDGSVIGRQVRHAALNELDEIRDMQADIEASIMKEELLEGGDKGGEGDGTPPIVRRKFRPTS